MCPKNFSVDVLIYFQIHRWSLKTAWPSAWDTRPWPRKGEPEDAAGRGQEIHAGITAELPINFWKEILPMKKNKFEFIIDSEFQSQIPALTDEEFQQLEENILVL